MTSDEEPAVRLVYTDLGLPELFARMASDAGLDARLVSADELAGAVIEVLRAAGATRVFLPPSSLLGRLGLHGSLESAGLAVVDTPDPDAAVTDCYAAVAETGTLVLELTPAARRVLSARVRVAVVDPRACVGDLLDLMDRIRQRAGELHLESGPSRFVAMVLH
jgi:L-lactate utilization protein LutC